MNDSISERTNVDADLIKRAEATLQVRDSDEEGKADKAYWRARACYFAEQIVRKNAAPQETSTPEPSGMASGPAAAAPVRGDKARNCEHCGVPPSDNCETKMLTGICHHSRGTNARNGETPRMRAAWDVMATQSAYPGDAQPVMDAGCQLERERAELEVECIRYREQEAERDQLAEERARSSTSQGDGPYWAFQYSDGSIWTDNMFDSKEQAERWAARSDSVVPNRELVEGANLIQVMLVPVSLSASSGGKP